jgi:carbon-monoxide dehydrogenase small subunit
VAVRVTLTVNGEERTADDVWPGESLLFTLRERLGLPGTKNACEQGECGSCTVLLDGQPVCACLVAAPQAQGRTVVTVEGIARYPVTLAANNERGADRAAPNAATADGSALHPVQAAFIEAGAVQCGFCTPGLVVTVVDLLRRRPDPTDSEIREATPTCSSRSACTGRWSTSMLSWGW